MSNVNEGHRARLRERMKTEGLHGFQDHEVLELLLFQYIPRKDTNKLAHSLLNKFGSFANVLDASPQQLMTVNGISETTACNLAVLKEVWQRYNKSAAEKISLAGLGSIVKYSQRIMSESYVEKMVVVYVDASTNFIVSEEFNSESTQTVKINLKKIVSSAVTANAAGVILFHCHVNGPCFPSDADKDLTEKLYTTLANLNIVLLEHMIFNKEQEYYSFFKERDLEEYRQRYQQNVLKRI